MLICGISCVLLLFTLEMTGVVFSLILDSTHQSCTVNALCQGTVPFPSPVQERLGARKSLHKPYIAKGEDFSGVSITPSPLHEKKSFYRFEPLTQVEWTLLNSTTAKKKRSLGTTEKFLVLSGMKSMVDRLKIKHPHLSDQELMRDFMDVMLISEDAESSKRRKKGKPKVKKGAKRGKSSSKKKKKEKKRKKDIGKKSQIHFRGKHLIFYQGNTHAKSDTHDNKQRRKGTSNKELSHKSAANSRSYLLFNVSVVHEAIILKPGINRTTTNTLEKVNTKQISTLDKGTKGNKNSSSEAFLVPNNLSKLNFQSKSSNVSQLGKSPGGAAHKVSNNHNPLEYLSSIAGLLNSFRNFAVSRKGVLPVSPFSMMPEQTPVAAPHFYPVTINNVHNGQLRLTPRLRNLPSEVATRLVTSMLNRKEKEFSLSPQDQYKVLALQENQLYRKQSALSRNVTSPEKVLVDEQTDDYEDRPMTGSPVIQQFTGTEEAFDWKPTPSSSLPQTAALNRLNPLSTIKSELMASKYPHDSFTSLVWPSSENFKESRPLSRQTLNELTVDAGESSGYVGAKNMDDRFPMIKSSKTARVPIIKSARHGKPSVLKSDHHTVDSVLGSSNTFLQEDDEDDDDEHGDQSLPRYGPTPSSPWTDPAPGAASANQNVVSNGLQGALLTDVKHSINRGTADLVPGVSSSRSLPAVQPFNEVDLLWDPYKTVPSEEKHGPIRQQLEVRSPPSMLQSQSTLKSTYRKGNVPTDGMVEYKTYDNTPTGPAQLWPSSPVPSAEGKKRTVTASFSNSSVAKPPSRVLAKHRMAAIKPFFSKGLPETKHSAHVPLPSSAVRLSNQAPAIAFGSSSPSHFSATQPIPLVMNANHALDKGIEPSDSDGIVPSSEKTNDTSTIMDELVEAIKTKQEILKKEGMKNGLSMSGSTSESVSYQATPNQPLSSSALKSIFGGQAESKVSKKSIGILPDASRAQLASPLDALGPPVKDWTQMPARPSILYSPSLIPPPALLYPTPPSLLRGTPPPVGVSYGRKFFVTIRLLNQIFEDSLYHVESWRFQKLRDEIQSAILRLYADDDTYAATKVLNFRPSTRLKSVVTVGSIGYVHEGLGYSFYCYGNNRVGKILVDLAMFFMKNGPHHLLPLEFQLHSGKLGDLEASKYIVNISRYEGEMEPNRWCNNACWNAFLCYPQCSEHCCAGPHPASAVPSLHLHLAPHPTTHTFPFHVTPSHPYVPPYVPGPPPLPMPYPYAAPAPPLSNPYVVYNVMITPPNIATQNPFASNPVFPGYRINPVVAARRRIGIYGKKYDIGGPEPSAFAQQSDFHLCTLGCPASCYPACSRLCCVVGRRRRKRGLEMWKRQAREHNNGLIQGG